MHPLQLRDRYLGIDLGRTDVRMPEHGLDVPDVHRVNARFLLEAQVRQALPAALAGGLAFSGASMAARRTWS